MTHRPESPVDAQKEAAYLETVRTMVLNLLEPYHCQAFLFGSRVHGPLKRSSDFDIGLRGLPPDQFNKLKGILLEAMDESPVPHSIDVVNFDTVSPEFSRQALKDIVVWKTA